MGIFDSILISGGQIRNSLTDGDGFRDEALLPIGRIIGEIGDRGMPGDQSRGVPTASRKNPGLGNSLDDLFRMLENAVVETRAAKSRSVKPAKAKAKAAKKPASKVSVGSSTGTGGAQAVDPRVAMAQQLMAGGSNPAFNPNDKQFLKSKQKQINSALLAARAPWDNAIVNTRAGLKGAQAAVDRAQMGVAPVMQGTQRGQEMLAQSDRASLDAARDAAMLRQAQEAQAQARALGISESAATEAGAAANIATQAETAAQMGDVDRRTDNAKGLASSIQQASALGAQESKQNIIRDGEREINRLRSQRTMGMAQARGSVEQQIAEFIKEQAGATSDAALESTKLGIALLNAVSSDQIKREGQATTRRGQDIGASNAANRAKVAAAIAAAKIQQDQWDTLIGLPSKTVRVTGSNGKDVYMPAFPQTGYGSVGGIAAAAGMPGVYGPQPVAPARGGMWGLSGLIDSLIPGARR